MISKVLGGLVVLVLMTSTGAIGFYYGGKFSPVSTSLTALGEIVYDEQAEARFNTRIEVLDAQLAEKEMDLAELEQKNRGLLRIVANTRSDYYTNVDEQSLVALDNREKFESISSDLVDSIEDNQGAQVALSQLKDLFAVEQGLFETQLIEANTYIIALEDSNRSILQENTLLRSINTALTNQNQIMRDRIADISGSRLRHGPGIATGLNPMDNYQLTALVGWTISWS